jgi:hypothetical protein
MVVIVIKIYKKNLYKKNLINLIPKENIIFI